MSALEITLLALLGWALSGAVLTYVVAVRYRTVDAGDVAFYTLLGPVGFLFIVGGYAAHAVWSPIRRLAARAMSAFGAFVGRVATWLPSR